MRWRICAALIALSMVIAPQAQATEPWVYNETGGPGVQGGDDKFGFRIYCHLPSQTVGISLILTSGIPNYDLQFRTAHIAHGAGAPVREVTFRFPDGSSHKSEGVKNLPLFTVPKILEREKVIIVNANGRPGTAQYQAILSLIERIAGVSGNADIELVILAFPAVFKLSAKGFDNAYRQWRGACPSKQTPRAATPVPQGSWKTVGGSDYAEMWVSLPNEEVRFFCDKKRRILNIGIWIRPNHEYHQILLKEASQALKLRGPDVPREVGILFVYFDGKARGRFFPGDEIPVRFPFKENDPRGLFFSVTAKEGDRGFSAFRDLIRGASQASDRLGLTLSILDRPVTIKLPLTDSRNALKRLEEACGTLFQ